MQLKRITLPDYLLVTKLFDDYRVFYKYPSDIRLAEKFIKERLENNESVVFIALADDGTSIGFTQLYPLISSGRAIKNWVLNDLYVAPEYRKQGIGEALIKTAREFAARDGAVFLQLETATDNYNAQRLYENIGFNKQDPDNSFFTYRLPLK
ncbi:MAG TPA: GNAT family N-acetyltransferase [Mucilaginibacter sp.]|jgi:ribosomal protein S18 acetylase RimI-like enzyme|nr:GNAT family N-acetyltransferase [Mucilaginibacter sp.]